MKINLTSKSEKFINSLDSNTIARVLHTIELLEKFGNDLELPHSKPLGRGLFELRTRGKSEIRILYTFYKESATLLHGYIKKTQKTPKSELDKAFVELKELRS